MTSRLWIPVVFLAASLLAGYRAGESGIASGWIDPVSRTPPQDEAVYSHTALRMARQGDWLTPFFMGRFAFYKPPLVYWLSGASAKLFGATPFALRLPSILAAGLAAALLFAWAARIRGPAWGAAAALLAVSNPVWHTLARLNLTDMVLLAASVASLAAVVRDPALSSRRSLWIFAAGGGLAILAKAAAGLLPLLAFTLFAAVRRDPGGPSRRRVAAAWLATAAVAAPWHLYQLAVHTRWFWTEYVITEHLSFGVISPFQASSEAALRFYLKRLFALDPVLLAAALASLPWLARALRKRPESMLAACWLCVSAAQILVFRYQNVPYLLPVVAVLALIAALHLPLPSGRITVLLLAGVLLAKSFAPPALWSLSWLPAAPVPTVADLEQYDRERSGRELIIVHPEDQFVSSLLEHVRVRYCYVDADDRYGRPPLDFRYLGIMVTAADFNNPSRLEAYAGRLRGWGLDSAEPAATVITARSVGEIAEMIRNHPSVDFFLPPHFDALKRQADGHTVRIVENGRFFLYARR